MEKRFFINLDVILQTPTFSIIITIMNWGTSNSAYGSYSNSYLRTSPSKRTTRLSPSKSKSGPLGLQNLTNTCYISAVMQVLFQIISENDFPISKKLQQEITYLFFSLKKTKDTGDYKRFKQALEDRIEIVRGWDQQDAHELLIEFIDQIRKQNSQKLASGQLDLSYKQAKSVEENWKHFVKEMEKIERSKIISLFYGETLKKYTCPKGHEKFGFERYSNLSLPFSPKSSTSRYYYYSSEGPLQLKDMIDEYLGEEIIDDLICQKCKQKMSFKKRACLYTVPKFLILHLSRFIKGYYDSQKNNREVKFEEYIKIYEQYTGKSVEYKLMGVIHHIGSLNRGHYYADVRIKDDWYQMDDDRVTTARISRYSNCSKSAYMLVYQRN